MRRSDRWNFLFIAECGFRICSTTTSAAPKCASFRMARRKGDFFCAYNTVIGWRTSSRHAPNARAKWYKRNGRPKSLRVAEKLT